MTPSDPVFSGETTGARAFQTKAEFAYQRLRELVLTGALAPGARLDQDQLAESLAVSRMPLRQALLKLESDGLIQMRPHHSAIVAPLSHSAIEELYAMRRALEGMLAAAGGDKLDDRAFATLDALLGYMAAATVAADWRRFVTLDRSFHRTIYERSGYARAVAEVERLRDASDRYILAFASYRNGASSSLSEHDAILNACRKRDAEEVRALTDAHIARGATVMLQLADEGAAASAGGETASADGDLTRDDSA